jgi:hypothetical protein
MPLSHNFSSHGLVPQVTDNLANEKKKKVKTTFDKKTKKDSFQGGDLVLRWTDRREDKTKNGKFDNFWFGPFRRAKVLNNNSFVLQNLDDSEIFGGPVNGLFLKHYFT